jgi:hypothetical protein
MAVHSIRCLWSAVRTTSLLLLVFGLRQSLAQPEILKLTSTGIVFRSSQTGAYAQVQLRMDLTEAQGFPLFPNTWHTWPTKGNGVIARLTNSWNFGEYPLEDYLPPGRGYFLRVVQSAQGVPITTTAYELVVENRGTSTVSHLSVWFDTAQVQMEAAVLEPQQSTMPFVFYSPDDWFVCPECLIVRWHYSVEYTVNGRRLERMARPNSQRSKLVIRDSSITLEDSITAGHGDYMPGKDGIRD